MPIKKFHAALTNNPKLTAVILLILTLIIFLAVFIFIPAIPQWESYHHFADTRTLWGIPHVEDVLSNLPFLLVSILGFWSLQKQWHNKNLTIKEAMVFCILFMGIFLTSLGSAYYHWSPDNNSLIWDRLPIMMVLMSIISIILMERVNLNLGFWLLFPLIALGIFSVLYWHRTELLGQGDLRLYGGLQFYSLLLIPAILILFPQPSSSTKTYIWMLIFYGISKLVEYYDVTIYQFDQQFISGHTLKHLFAAISLYCLIIILKQKRRVL